MRRGALLVMMTGVTAAACSFPEIEFLEGTSSGALTGSTTSVTATSSTGADGGGGAAPTSTSGSNGGGGSGTTGQGGGDCNIDRDPGTSWDCRPPGDDCADEDDRAWFGTGEYYATAIQGNKNPATPAFDFNCNSSLERFSDQLFKGTGILNCGINECLVPVPEGYKDTATCGLTDQYYKCETVMGVCQPKLQPTAPEPLKCH